MRLAQADKEPEISTGNAAAIQSSLPCATGPSFYGSSVIALASGHNGIRLVPKTRRLRPLSSTKSGELPPGSESDHFRILHNQSPSAVTMPRASRTEDELQRVRSAMPILMKLAKQRRRRVP